MITEGDGFVYSALQPLQGFMLKQWKHNSSSTMLHPDLTDSVNAIDQALPDLPFWCSVDYEAATDLLKKSATFAAFEGMRGSPWFNLGQATLFPGRAIYPNSNGRYDKSSRTCLSIEGQLMGHPLSFPLLCVINLAVYRHALWLWVRGSEEFTLEVRTKLYRKMLDKVLVNGDDMLFKCTQDFHDRFFLPTCKQAGFKISTGKHYLSPIACMINSQLFRRRNSVMVKCGYFNQKMLIGSSLKEGESLATPTQIGKELSSMVLGCPWTRCSVPATFSRFGKEWFGPIYRPNWYFPVHLGGFGVDSCLAPSDWKSRVTRDQRQMAARFINDPAMTLYRKSGMSIPSARFAQALCHFRYQIGDYIPFEDEITTENDDWLARVAYAARAQNLPPVDDNIMTVKFRPEYRLKPMSWERIELYWKAQLFSRGTPVCPPLPPIELPQKASGIRQIMTLKSGYGPIVFADYQTRPTFESEPAYSWEGWTSSILS